MARHKTLDDLFKSGDIRGKRVLVRADLNVPAADGKVTDTTRLSRIAGTLTELAGKGAKVIVLSHFGRPKAAPDPKYTLAPVAVALGEVIGHKVAFASDCIGAEAKKAIDALPAGGILVLENTRFHAGEEKNDPAFVKALAENGDIYVNDAFSAAHRAHASTEGLAHVLAAYAGRAMEAELDALDAALGHPEHPVVAVVGGAKVSTKIALLSNLIRKVDTLVVGGGMANTFLAAQGRKIGKSLCEYDLLDKAREILADARSAGCEVVLPADVVVAREFKAGAEARTVPADAVPEDMMILDVGTDTLAYLAAVSKRPNRRLERPARRLRDSTLRPGHRLGRAPRRHADQDGHAEIRGGRRRHRGRAQRCGRRRRFHLRLGRGRSFPRMDGRRRSAGRCRA